MSDRTESTAGGSSEGGSWLASLSAMPSMPGTESYFSLRATVGIALAVGAGILLGGMTLPAGRLTGLAAVAVTIGALAPRRLYAEVVTAGIAIGGISALFNHALLAAGSGESMAAVGFSTGLMVCLTGYYLGRLARSRLGIGGS